MALFHQVVLSVTVSLYASICFAAPIRGVVTNEAKKPLADATVQIIAKRQYYYMERDLTPLSETRTDSNGEFALDSPTTGDLALLAWAPGYRRTRFPFNAASATTVKIGVALQPGRTISGKVVDSRGQPLTDVLLGPLLPGIDAERELADRHVPQWTRTDSSGNFRFTSVMRDLSLHFIACAPAYELVDTEVGPSDKPLVVKLKRGGSAVPVQLVSKRQPSSALAGTQLRLDGNGFNVIELAGMDGSFTFTGIPAGGFSVEALTETGSSNVATVTLPNDAGTTVQIEISPGSSE